MYTRISTLKRVEKVFRTFPNLNGKLGTSTPCFEFCKTVSKQINTSSLAVKLGSVCNRQISSSVSKVPKDSFSDKNNNPDEFGNLSDEPASLIPEYGGDLREEQYVSNPVSRRQGMRLSQYQSLIKEHLDKKEIQAAIDVVETRMKEDRVKPTSYIFRLLISGCGKNGELTKAYQMYRKMLDHGLKVPDSVYTALFNACATCVDPDVGLKKAQYLRSKMIEKGVELNRKHCHAMVKAFGRCGDLYTAFQMVDVMMDKGIPISEETCNFLLHACITDRTSGFRYALLVWHKMLDKRIQPTIFTFNLLLRAVRDCGVGQAEEFEKTLQQLLLPAGLLQGEVNSLETNPTLFSISPSLELQFKDSSQSVMNLTSVEDNFPDLLLPTPRLGNFTSALDLTKSHHRLTLLGGSRGFLRHMAKYEVNPTMKTYTVLLDCIPPTLAAEKILLSNIKKKGLKLDTAFCNMLIKKRSFRFDYENAKEVLNLIKTEKLYPDLITYGVLALSCKSQEEAEELIADMKAVGYRCNEEILGAMIYSACVQHNFKYLMRILYLSDKEEVQISSESTKRVDTLIASCKDILNKQQSGAVLPESLREKPFKKEFMAFLFRYRAWVEKMREKAMATSASKERAHSE